MKEDMLIQIFNKDTCGNNYAKGQRVLNNDLVSSYDLSSKDDLIYLDGNVISENLFNEYHTKINIDAKVAGIVSTSCTCQDFEKNGYKKRNYCCKHLVASFYKAVEELSENFLFKNNEEDDKDIFINKDNVLSLLISDEDMKEEIKLEVFINRDEWDHNLTAEFKIGLKNSRASSMCVIKDINMFLIAYDSSICIEYSKSFVFSSGYYKFDVKSKRLIDFVKNLRELEGRNDRSKFHRGGEPLLSGKLLTIPDFMTRSFFEVIKFHKVYLNEGFFLRPVETEILMGEPYIDFDMKLIKDNYILKSVEGMPVSLSSNNDVLLYGTSIYLPNYEFCYKLLPYLKLYNQSKVLTISSKSEDIILRKLIPELYSITPNVTLSNSIKNKIIREDVLFNFYFDRDGMEVYLIVKVKYGPCEFMIFEEIKDKVIYRDTIKEKQVIAVLESLGFEAIDGRFCFIKGEEYLFRFFKNEIDRLKALGEVYYSHNFKGLKHIGTKGIKAEIKAGKYDCFEMDFKIDDIPRSEINNILKAFKDNLKYYRLKNGEYIDLEEIELKKFLKLLDSLSPFDINDNNLKFSKNKAYFVDEYLEKNDIRYIKGIEEFREIRNKINNINDVQMDLPFELTANLRDYQKTGFKWLKTLDYLGFGGILGDEMGLGKTLQAISLILSNKGQRTLIVTPTSLIYNWVNEFESFAPTIKIVACVGNKNDREAIIKNINEYEVLITTYNLLKRDIESYKALEFDFCIIDEAQYIKNPNAQNAMAVKEIKAKTRFALTGTPIENSLMELWSIFDFIMPGYLFDEKRFSARFHKRHTEEPEVLEELNRLIKPFILRRKKSDVIKELPDKIEKKLIVPLEDEQKVVYGIYAKHAQDLIKKRVEEDEFKSSRIEILAYLTRLRQICLDPSILMKDYKGGSGKIDALMEVLEQSIEEGHRILVFSQFTSVLKNIGSRLTTGGMAFSYLDGSISSEQRINIVREFNEGNNLVFLISLKAGGTGLNITSADVVIHFDPWWNPAVEEQATDRAHRIGQKRVVEVIKLIAKGTIEEKVVMLQEQKKKLISELMGDELTETDGLTALTEAELLGLFKIAVD